MNTIGNLYVVVEPAQEVGVHLRGVFTTLLDATEFVNLPENVGYLLVPMNIPAGLTVNVK